MSVPKCLVSPPIDARLTVAVTNVWADGLCGLYLDRNTITELPEQCAKFKCLTALSIADNLLTEFPSWIGSLSRLKTLAAPRNQIAHVCQGLSHICGVHSCILGQYLWTPRVQY